MADLEAERAQGGPAALSAYILPMEKIFHEWPRAVLSNQQVDAVLHGAVRDTCI